MSRPNNAAERAKAKFWIECENKLAEGKSISKIAKETGKSYTHTKRVCEWIQSFEYEDSRGRRDGE